MIGRILLIVILSWAWGAGGSAWAQTFSVNSIELRDKEGGILTDEEIKNEFFNRARCECAEPIRITLRITPDITDRDNLIYFVVGTGTCINTNDNSIDESSCRILYSQFVRNLKTDPDITITNDDGETKREPTVADLMLDRCTQDQKINLYVFKGTSNNLTPITPHETTISADGQLPDAPTSDKDPEPGEGIVTLHFTSNSDTEPNARYQILCEVEGSGQPGLANPPGPDYDSTASTCSGAVSDGGVDGDGGVDATMADMGADGMVSDAGVDGPTSDGDVSEGGGAGDGGVAEDSTVDSTTADGASSDGETGDGSTSASITSLDAAFVCSESSPSDGSITVKGLQNKVSYRFYVVAIDEHRNPSSPTPLGTATPVLAEDLWERYKRSGGEAEGGFCSVDAPAGGGAFFCAAFALIALIARRRVGR